MQKLTIKTMIRLAILATTLGATISEVSAQPSPNAKFDAASQMSLTGIVTLVDWKNPRTHVFMNVTNGAQVVNWAIELDSPLVLKGSGWSESTLKPGDKIDVKGIRARNGSRQVWSQSLKVGGKEVFTVKDLKPVMSSSSAPAPRGADGKIMLGEADGYWGFPSSHGLVEEGAKVTMDRYGQLAQIGDAAKVAPMQPWALKLYQNRQQRNLQDDPMFLNCIPPGGPRQFQSDLGVKFVEDKVNQRVFVLMGSGNHNYRIIYLDGREQKGSVTGDDDNPLFFGRSSGKWEGDTLVVNTKGFNEGFWFSNGGMPHTSNLVLTERFTRTNKDSLNYEVTIDDVGAYTRPWKASWTLQHVAGQELPIHFCQNNRP